MANCVEISSGIWPFNKVERGWATTYILDAAFGYLA